MKCFVSFPCLLVVLSALSLSVMSTAVAQQSEQRGATQEHNDGAKHQALLLRADLRNIDGNDSQPAPGQNSGLTQTQIQTQTQGRERLSLEERRQLRSDINAAGRDIYRQERSGRANRF